MTGLRLVHYLEGDYEVADVVDGQDPGGKRATISQLLELLEGKFQIF